MENRDSRHRIFPFEHQPNSIPPRPTQRRAEQPTTINVDDTRDPLVGGAWL
jgi:hypothetical protein